MKSDIRRAANRVLSETSLWVTVGLAGFVPLLGTILARTYLSQWHFVSEPLHAALEAAGAMAALGLAFTLLLAPEASSRTSPVMAATALLTMGLLDVAHASLPVNNVSVWLRSLATLAGGLLFALTWLPRHGPVTLRRWYLVAAGMGMLAMGIWLRGQVGLPQALDEARFAPAIAMINYAGGTAFLVACIRYCVLLRRHRQLEDLLKANFCLLFGGSGLLLPSSHLWGGEWWYWHILRLLGYLLILVHMMLSVARTSSALKESNAELCDTLRRLQLATTSAAIGIWEWDVAADRLVWDAELHRLYGLPAEQFGGNFDAWLRCLAPEERPRAQAAIDAALRGESELAGEFRILWPNGSEHFILAAGRTYHGGDGKALRMVGVNQDVTARQLAERRLRNQQEHLEELVTERTSAWRAAAADAQAASRAKSLFLSNMSHELRTPMNAIIGFSTLMQRESGLGAEQRQNLGIISRSGEHLLNLINDVLDMSKIEAGRVSLETAPFDLHATLRGVVDLMQERAEAKGLAMQLQQSSKVPRCIHGDEGKLRQVLINLLGNAVKFTSRGGVVLRLDLGGPADAPALHFEIEDSGAGIATEHQPHIFEPFVQVGMQSEQKGTGLGLTITRQVVELMDGTIKLESTPGHGTLFRLTLPMTPASADDVRAPLAAGRRVLRLAPGQPPCRVLVVEDQADNARLIERLLTGAGFFVDIARDGEAGVAAFLRSAPHFIWMDRRMPRMDGIEACRTIRALPGGDKIRIVGLTASILQEEKGELLAAGMDEIVSKPYTHDEIFNCLARLLHLTYLYEDVTDDESAAPSAIARLSNLPAALQNTLREALFSFDTAAVDGVVASVATEDAVLGTALAGLIEQSNHSAILQALGPSNQ